MLAAKTAYASNALPIVLTLLLSHLTTPVSSFGVTSYANLFVDPAQVLNNTWFDDNKWSRTMAKDWSTDIHSYGPWSECTMPLLLKLVLKGDQA
jgi:hypothetical protein